MWSGPRNISTAMMRAWGSLADTAVTDEPFYAGCLAETGPAHPMRDRVPAAQSAEWDAVARDVLERPEAAHWYERVNASTGFAPYRQPGPVPAGLEEIVAECRPHYERLYAHRLET